MSFSVVLQPGGETFSVPDSQTVTEAAIAAGVGMAYSCKRGTCRTCRSRILSGEYSQPGGLLRPDDVEAGYALLCQTKPLSDLVIAARVLPVVQTGIARALVTEMHRAAPDVMILSLRLPPVRGLNFRAGQYLDVLLPEDRQRSYSIATPPRPEGNWEFDLHIRHVPGGRFTDEVFSTMAPRQVLTIRGPLGSCSLQEDSEKPIVLVASGTGYAPIRAIIQSALAIAPQREIHLYWGGRNKADLYRASEPESWAAEHPRFKFVPVLSEPLPEWDGRTGYVHRAVMTDFPDLSGVQVYACGAPVMVEAARQDFVTSCGLPENEFFADAFLTEADLKSAPP